MAAQRIFAELDAGRGHGLVVEIDAVKAEFDRGCADRTAVDRRATTETPRTRGNARGDVGLPVL